MASTNKTEILKLNQFLGTDKVKMADFNYDNARLEEILKDSVKTVVFDSNEYALKFEKLNGEKYTVAIAKYSTATDTIEGLITLNTILKILQKYGIGTTTISNIDINAYLPSGIYTARNVVNGKPATVVNSQYDTNWGSQLAITEEREPKSYVRSRQNGSWTSWQQLGFAGLDRYKYGYLEDLTNISIETGNASLTLSWTTPSDLNFQGVKIVRKSGSYPVGVEDGTVVHVSTEKGNVTFVDNNLENGREYFYRLFTYNKQDVYNDDENAILKGTPQSFLTYTVIIDENNSNPETSVTYADEAEGMSPGWDNWKDTPLFKNIKPCVLKNGRVNYYLQKDNRTLKENGQNANLNGRDGDVMIEFPEKLAYKIERKGTKLHISVTNNPHADSSWSYAGFMNYTNRQTYNKMYVGAYQSSNDYRSKSGVSTATSITHSTFESGFQRNGGQMWSFGSVTLLQCLYLIIYKNLNSQTALGKGHTNGSDYTRTTGDTNSKKFCWGSQNGRERVVFLGLESFYGTSRAFIGGIKKDGSNNIILGHNNKSINNTQVNNSGYLKKVIGNNDLAFLSAEATGGSENTYYCDYFCAVGPGDVLLFGGHAGSDAYAGAFVLYGDPGSSYSYYGSRFMYLTN